MENIVGYWLSFRVTTKIKQRLNVGNGINNNDLVEVSVCWILCVQYRMLRWSPRPALPRQLHNISDWLSPIFTTQLASHVWPGQSGLKTPGQSRTSASARLPTHVVFSWDDISVSSRRIHSLEAGSESCEGRQGYWRSLSVGGGDCYWVL